MDVAKIQEKKAALEEELRRTEKQIYDLEGEYLEETLKDGNILRGWDGYLGKQASSGAIRRINRFREADRMFSASSVTSGQASTFTAKAADGAGPSASSGGAKVKKARHKRSRELPHACSRRRPHLLFGHGSRGHARARVARAGRRRQLEVQSGEP